MKNELIDKFDKNQINFINNCSNLNINVVKDNKLLKKSEIFNKINNYKFFLKRKTLKMLEKYINHVTDDNYLINLEKVYKLVKKYDNKLKNIIKYLNDDYVDEDVDVSSIFLDSDINLLNIDIKIEDIKDNKSYLDEYNNS